jgi:hypothetical protein
MKITCTQASEQGGKRIEKSASVELPDNAIEPNADKLENEKALKAIIAEIFEGIKT